MDINTGLPRLFLLIKLTSLISISSVTEESVFLRRLYSTEVFNSVCLKSQKSSECETNVYARLFPECDYIFAIWVGVRKVASADNRSVFYCAQEKIRHAIRKELKFVTSFVNFARVLRESNLRTTNLLKLCFVFLLFSLTGLKIFQDFGRRYKRH